MNGAAEMSIEDKDPAQDGNVRPVYPVTFYGDRTKSTDRDDSPYTDFRAMVVPANAEEEVPEAKNVPKVESAPASVDSSESTESNEPPEPATPAPTPAVKDNGPSKVTVPGKPASSPAMTRGKIAPPAKA